MVADALSRSQVAACLLPSLDLAALAAAQTTSDAKDSSLVLAKVLWQGTELLCDTSTGSP